MSVRHTDHYEHLKALGSRNFAVPTPSQSNTETSTRRPPTACALGAPPTAFAWRASSVTLILLRHTASQLLSPVSTQRNLTKPIAARMGDTPCTPSAHPHHLRPMSPPGAADTMACTQVVDRRSQGGIEAKENRTLVTPKRVLGFHACTSSQDRAG